MARFQRIWSRIGTAARHYDVHPARIVARAMRLRGLGIRLERANTLGLLDPQLPWTEVAKNISGKEFFDCLDLFNASSDEMLLDKALFDSHCRTHALPVPELFAVVENSVATTLSGGSYRTEEEWLEFFRSVLPRQFVVKPALGDYGYDIVSYERTEQSLRDHLGGTIPILEARNHVFSSRKYVVQERVECHPDVCTLSGSAAAQTIRLITVVERTGAVRTWSAAIRLVRGKGIIDNYQGGNTRNYYAMIQMESGRITDVWTPTQTGVGFEMAKCHADTGNDFAGFAVPYFEEALELGKRAAEAFLPLRAIGWDIAVTPNGPCLLEGNSGWGDQGERTMFMDRQDLEAFRVLA